MAQMVTACLETMIQNKNTEVIIIYLRIIFWEIKDKGNLLERKEEYWVFHEVIIWIPVILPIIFLITLVILFPKIPLLTQITILTQVVLICLIIIIITQLNIADKYFHLT